MKRFLMTIAFAAFSMAISAQSLNVSSAIKKFDDNFKLGALYFNRAVDMTNAANAIDPFDESQVSQYEKLMEKAGKLYRQSITYLENAVAYVDGLTDEEAKAAMRVNLLNALGALESSYTRVDMLDKANAIKARRDEILKQQ